MRTLANTNDMVLLVEDRETMRRSLRRLLAEAGYTIEEAADISSAKAKLSSHTPDIILSDLRLPDGEGTDLIPEALQQPKPPPVILITAYGSVETAVQAMKSGAYDFLTKPVDSQHLLLLVKRAIEETRIKRQYELLAREHESGAPILIGENTQFRAVMKRASTAAPTDTTVLILGESGTGKELLARIIHQQSPRRDASFIPVNCAAISASLAESVLFGHERGAFTGATTQHRGWFELAHGGTLLLDEIGDLELPLQGKLLRVLEDGELQRVGGSRWIKVDVRIIAASNRALLDEVDAGRFRRDLYYRLAVFPLTIPPLRDRLDDVPLLAEYFRSIHSGRFGKHDLSFPDGVLDELKNYRWPGNVRELSNIVERAVILAKTGKMNRDLFPVIPVMQPMPRQTISEVPSNLKGYVADAVERIERDAIVRALEQTSGNRSHAARMLGITYRTLLNKLKAFGMDVDNMP